MIDTIDLKDGWVVDRVPWEALERLVLQLFPDVPEDNGKAAEFRNDVLEELMRKGNAYWLGRAQNRTQEELLKLKRCDEGARRCKFRQSD